MIKSKKKKLPSDYPLYVFRTDQKEEIDIKAEDLVDLYNKGRNKSTDKKITKGQILNAALLIGFKELKRRRT